ncbi:M1 family metallopeptidase [Sphingomonas bacterium]|uniref:M1 family metallopeptidase n=1 Tax=Sphingomonas bacterium TaxID=1895847 RepID=UPI00157565BC|nr:M1 family metallopeptidase [Sphingomonas bacterium]
MRPLLAALLLTCASGALAATADPSVPLGRLADAATPTAYRLDMTILPDRPRFTGHDEIDVTVKAPTTHLYMHGRDLAVSRSVATVGGTTMPVAYTQVDPTGVVRLDFPEPVSGPITLTFDYDAAFGSNPSGLYRINVAGTWYSWTQFESIDARAAFPSFDEPGYKTPFAISITTAPGNKAVSNAPEASVTTVGALERHVFQVTKPLPTYLVAMVTGPFLHPTGAVPVDAERLTRLPLGVVTTGAQAGRLDYAMAETPRIVSLLERYFGQSFPFPKLDQIGSPVMPGAMENAGADIYGDGILLLDGKAPTRSRQTFGMVVSHELSHQWFGDLVSPAWWDDTWLNESFANWMGYRIGNEWRPELNIGVGGIAEGFSAMNTDALEVGRPIHQHIATNAQIDDAFDTITYGKGGQVITMIAAYLGDDRFKAGVRLHLSRHQYGNATSNQFFQALADSARDPRVVAAMRSFVDQQGVPVVSIRRDGGRLVATQSRYGYLGSRPSPERWTIPLCVRTGTTRACTLLDRPTMTIDAAPADVIMPNAGGTGYYRFDLAPADWKALIAQGAGLDAGEALASDDSLYAAFRAGTAPAGWIVDAARAMAGNPNSEVALEPAGHLASWRRHGFLTPATMPAYRALVAAIYAPRLASLGGDLKAGAYAADAPDRQKLRQELLSLLAGEAQDAALRARMAVAANAYLAGDRTALDPAIVAPALGVVLEQGGLPASRTMMARALASEDASFRSAAIGAIGTTGRADVAQWLLGFRDPRLRSLERLQLLAGLAGTPETTGIAGDWILANYATLAAGGNGIFTTSRLPGMFALQCGVDRADRLDRTLGPKVRAANAGVLEFERTVETIRHCGALRDAKQAEINAAIATPS